MSRVAPPLPVDRPDKEEEGELPPHCYLNLRRSERNHHGNPGRILHLHGGRRVLEQQGSVQLDSIGRSSQGQAVAPDEMPRPASRDVAVEGQRAVDLWHHQDSSATPHQTTCENSVCIDIPAALYGSQGLDLCAASAQDLAENPECVIGWEGTATFFIPPHVTVSILLPPNYTASLESVLEKKCTSQKQTPLTAESQLPQTVTAETREVKEVCNVLLAAPHAHEKLVSVKQNKNKTFPCTQCEKIFNFKKRLTCHLRTHLKDRVFSCSHCKYNSTEKNNLAKHIVLHIGKKSFKCSVCGKTFLRKYHLSQHVGTHLTEKPFKCSQCEYRCIRKRDLARHMGVHAKVKPYKCPTCERELSRKDSFTQHLKTHLTDKPFKCSQCKYSCIRKNSLASHMGIHAKVKP